MIALITPTGARPRQIELCAKWMKNQTYKGKVLWVIVDDAIPPTIDHITKDFKEGWVIEKVFPTETWNKKSGSTQARNILKAIEVVREYKETVSVFIIEDDDYYAPNYLEFMVEKLKWHRLVGERNTRYYNINIKGCRECANTTHGSLFQTAFRVCLLNAFEHCAKLNPKFIDLKFWRTVPFSHSHLFISEERLSIGIKGMKGRDGIGAGHTPDKLFFVKAELEEFIKKEDAKEYLNEEV
jgi:hypothetical protein